MAARQNQGYLIWIIVLVIVSLMLALTAFLGIQKAVEYADVNKQTEVKLNQQTAMNNVRQIQAQIQAALIGNKGESISEVENNLDAMNQILNGVPEGERASVGEVIKQTQDTYDVYKKDMALLLSSADGTTNPQATYSGVFESLASALKRKVDDIAVLQNDVTRIKLDTKKEIDAKQAELDQAKIQLAAVSKDFELEKTRRAEDQNVYRTSLSTINTDNTRKNDEFATKQVELSNAADLLENANTKLAESNVELKQKVDKYEEENFDLADGSIVRVMDGLHKVIIDLGSASGLRTNRTFAIYNQGITNFEKNAHKATIEVTNILGPRSAEARITYESMTNPILAGDPILTATWDPGYRVEIALGGIFDLDFDGYDDRDKLIQDIESNGGKVVAWNDSEGNVHGEIGPSTRYFVLGDAQTPGPDFNSAIATAASRLRKAAVDANVQIIDSRKLMGWMGKNDLLEPTVIPLDDKIGEPFQRREAAQKAREESERFNDDQ
jgi:hypothetical protein